MTDGGGYESEFTQTLEGLWGLYGRPTWTNVTVAGWIVGSVTSTDLVLSNGRRVEEWVREH